MTEGQARTTAMLMIDQLSEPARKLVGTLEAAKVALEMDEPDIAIRCCGKMMELMAEFQIVGASAAAMQDRLIRREGGSPEAE